LAEQPDSDGRVTASRITTAVLAAVCCGLVAATALLGVSVAHHTSSGPRVASASSVVSGSEANNALAPRARGPGQTAAIRSVLRSRFVLVSAPPGQLVAARLVRGGAATAAARARAEADGTAVLRLESADGSLPRLAPADVLEITLGEGAPISAEIPDLVAHVDEPAGAVVGLAPPGSTIAVDLNAAEGPPPTVVANEEGRFALSLPEGALEPGSGAAVGAARLTDGDWAFEARFAPLSITATLGWQRIEATGSPGERLSALHRRADGREVPGSAALVGADGAGSGDDLATIGRAILSLRDPLEPGDTVTVERSAPGLEPFAQSLAAHDIAVQLETGRPAVTGGAPPGAEVEIELVDDDGRRWPRAATAGGDGRFRAEIPELSPGAGWRTEASVRGPAGATRAIAALPLARVRVDAASVGGRAAPFAPVRVSVYDGTGATLGPWRAEAGPDGSFTAALTVLEDGRSRPRHIAPGDVVLFDFAEGDPVAVEVPPLTAAVDTALGAIEGRAPAGARIVAQKQLRLRRAGGGAGMPPVVEATAVADAAGRYSAPFPPEHAPVPPDHGAAAFARPDGHIVEAAWAALALTATLGGAEVRGIAAPEQPVEVRLDGPSGATLATATLRAGQGEGGAAATWAADLTDGLGNPLQLRPGDRLQARVGHGEAALELPELEGVIHVGDDLIAGRTAPGVKVTIGVRRPGGAGGGGSGGSGENPEVGSAGASVRSDDTGTFAHSFEGAFDVLYNDRVRLTAHVGEHAALRTISAPGLRLDLGSGMLRGSLEPDLGASARLERGGVVVAERAFRTAPDATFEVALRDGSGPILAAAGDILRVAAPGAGGARDVAMVVPVLELELDAAADALAGRADPDAALELGVHNAFDDLGAAVDLRPEIDAAGTWSARLRPEHDIRPGSMAAALLRLPTGHLAGRLRAVPVLSARHGSDMVCGRADPHAAIELGLVDGGGGSAGSVGMEAAATAKGRADDGGAFRLRLRGPGGSPAVIEQGSTLLADIGGVISETPIERFEARLSTAENRVSGVAPAGALVRLSGPLDALDCAGDDGRGAMLATRTARAGEDGGFAFRLTGKPPRAALEGREVSLTTADGNRLWRPVRGVRAEAHVYRPLVTGSAQPADRLSLAVLDGRGDRIAGAEADVGPDGRFEALVLDDAGEPHALLPAERLEVRADPDAEGDPDVVLVIEHLAFDVLGDGTIAGSALPDRIVGLNLRLLGGRVVTLELTARADDGRWSFGPGGVPPRAGWSLDDVASVRAAVEVPEPGMHAMVAEAVLRPDLGRVLFMPRVISDS